MKNNRSIENFIIILISVLFGSNVLAQDANIFDTTNVWRYQSQFFDGVNPYPPDTFDVSIVETKIFGRMTYYKLFPTISMYEYIRADSSGYYCFIPEVNQEYELYPYDLEVVGLAPSLYATHITVGPPFNVGGFWDTNKVYKEIEWIGSPFGVTSQSYQFYHWGGFIDLNHYHIVVNKNFGITSHRSGSISGTYFTDLIGCRISGVNYGTLVDVNDPLPSSMEYSLLQNYPNPFNPVTTIQYSISRPEKVSIKVYDLLGREVALLLNDEQTAGYHEVKFDASNLVSGTYIYRIVAGDFVQSRKMILMK